MAKKKKRPSPQTLGLPLCGVDSHAHLDMRESVVADHAGIFERAREAGVARIGQVFLGPEAYFRNKSMFDAYPETFFLCGVHPTDFLKVRQNWLEQQHEAFCSGDERLRAMGEIGLDYYWKDVPHDVQKQGFKAQLAQARELDLPIAIHCRDAEEDTLSILDAEGFRDRPLLWHCFGGNTRLADEILSRGWLISVPGPVTYSRNEDLQAAVAHIPLERMLVETDTPFLTAEPWRGKPNEPALVAFTAAKIAEIKGLPVEDVWRTTGENALRFFGLL